MCDTNRPPFVREDIRQVRRLPAGIDTCEGVEPGLLERSIILLDDMARGSLVEAWATISEKLHVADALGP